MVPRRRTGRWLLYALGALLASQAVLGGRAPLRAEPVRGRVLRELEVEELSDLWIIRVGFNVPLRLLRHAPGDRGRHIAIELTPLPLGAGEVPAVRSREALRPPPEAWGGVPLVEVVYEGGRAPAPDALQVDLSRVCDFRVRPGRDSRSLEIQVYKRSAAPVPQAAPPAAPAAPSRAEALLVEARRAITADQLDRATTLLRKAADASGGDDAVARDAVELLGVILERRGQLAHARAEYEEYLARWPDAEGAARVAQRLETLLTARDPVREPRRDAIDYGEDETEIELYGSVSASYSRLEAIGGVTAGEVHDSSIFTDLALITRVRDPRYELRGELIGSRLFDLAGSTTVGDETRVSSLFADVASPDRRLGATLGRQSRGNGGVLGRFDGLRLERAFEPGWLGNRVALSALAGFPVDRASVDSFDTERLLYGAAVDFEDLGERVDAQLFFTGQRNRGMVDRMAVGGELRWIEPGRFFLGFVDYDVHFASLNTALLSGHLQVGDRWTLDLLGETRNTPVLTLDNALIGQVGIDDLGDLTGLDESELADLARDRTSRSWTGSAGLTHRTSRRVQLGGDLVVTSIEGTPASNGVDALPDVGPEYGVVARASLNDLWLDGDYTNLNLGYRLGELANTTSWNASLRLPVTRNLFTTLRFRGDYREGSGSGPALERLTLVPSLRTDWRTRAIVERLDLFFDVELGLTWTDDFAATLPADELGYFGVATVRLDF